jgi:hypothetical protein
VCIDWICGVGAVGLAGDGGVKMGALPSCLFYNQVHHAARHQMRHRCQHFNPFCLPGIPRSVGLHHGFTWTVKGCHAWSTAMSLPNCIVCLYMLLKASNWLGQPTSVDSDHDPAPVHAVRCRTATTILECTAAIAGRPRAVQRGWACMTAK